MDLVRFELKNNYIAYVPPSCVVRITDRPEGVFVYLNNGDRLQLHRLVTIESALSLVGAKVRGGGGPPCEEARHPYVLVDDLERINVLKVFSTPVGEGGEGTGLWLSPRAANVLQRAGLHFIGDVAAQTAAQLRTLRNCGRRTVGEIAEELEEKGLKLGMDVEALGWVRPKAPKPATNQLRGRQLV